MLVKLSLLVGRTRILFHHWMAVIMENNNEEKAVYHLKKLAALGDGWGLLALGCRYLEGKAVEKDYCKAFHCFKDVVCRDGDYKIFAEANIGSMYLNGQCLPIDKKQAASWYKRAALGGHPISQYNFGLSLIDGWDGKREFKEGIWWLHKASAAGVTEADEVLIELKESLGSDLLN